MQNHDIINSYKQTYKDQKGAYAMFLKKLRSVLQGHDRMRGTERC